MREKAPAPDAAIVERANAYARRISDIEMGELSGPLSTVEPTCPGQEHALAEVERSIRKAIDNAVSNAFVVGYAAGYEDGRSHLPRGKR